MKTRQPLAVALLILLLPFVAAMAVAAPERGVVRITDPAGQELGQFSESHALIIGASGYRNGWPALPGVKGDITSVKQALEGQGFSVTLVDDPDSQGLRAAFDRFIRQHGQKESARLLIWFAGHGHTEKLSYGDNMGYIVPVDAPNPNSDKEGFLASALDMQQIEVYAKRIQARHALFLFDSCFSGSLFALVRAVPEAISAKTAKPVRQFITAGQADETVPDRSLFRDQFLAALGGEGDTNRDGYLTGAELGEFLQTSVTNYSHGSQHPQYGKIRHPQLDKGDFVFRLGAEKKPDQPTPPSLPVTPPQPAPAPSIDPAAVELSYWESVKESGDAAQLQSYLSQYPQGRFTQLAQLKIRALNKPATPAPEAKPPAPVSEGKTYRDPTTGMEFVKIAGGSFDMGSPAGEKDRDKDEKQHRVSVGSFYLAKHEVTLGQFRRFVNATNYRTDAERNVGGDGCYRWKEGKWEMQAGIAWNNPGFKQGDNHPVVCISWNDATAYAEWLSKETGKHYRLPTEAEWEYAARAGTATARHWGDDPDDACRYANVADQTTHEGYSFSTKHNCNDGYWFTAPVGNYRANAFGLHDILGNVWEWTCSAYDKGYGGGEQSCASQGDGGQRANRGGGGFIIPAGVRSATRGRGSPAARTDNLGFRLLQEGRRVR